MKRNAVQLVVGALDVSERKACRVMGQHRSTQRYHKWVPEDEEVLPARIIELASQYGRYGYRRVTALLRNEGWIVNHKRVERIWRQIFSDVFNMEIIKTNIGKETGSLGVAAIVAVGCGIWEDFSKVDEIHQVESVSEPVMKTESFTNSLIRFLKS